MKKNLLLTGALLTIGMASFAQTTTVGEPMVKANRSAVTSTDANTAVMGLKPYTVGKSAVSRAVADGTYYTRPVGTMFRAFNEEGMGSYTIQLYMPSFKECTFVNKSANPTTSKWYLITDNGEFDMTEDADASGNYSFTTDGLHVWPIPTLENGETRFVLGENSLYKDKPNASFPRMLGTGSVSSMSYFNDHDFEKNQLGWGVLSTHYLYGSGTYTSKGITYTSIGAIQSYEKPASPLYVESTFVEVFSFEATTPIPTGKTITMAIVGTETQNTIATLTATAEDMKGYGLYDNTSYGAIYSGGLVFSNKVVDPILGVPVAEPFVINEPFTVIITGLDQDGVNFGLGGVANTKESGVLDEAGLLLRDPGTNEIKNLSYTTPLSLRVGFNGLFDGIKVYDNVPMNTGNVPNGNQLKISDDGTTCAQTNGTNLPGVLIATATPWKDEDGNEYYYFDNQPEWITSVNVDESLLESNGFYMVSVTADKLEGTEGRTATLYLKGRGITADIPVVVTQGKVTTGIENAVVSKDENKDGKVYNLNGQRVSEGTKGILIKDGKKIINN